jgi:hypothetical protein
LVGGDRQFDLNIGFERYGQSFIPAQADAAGDGLAVTIGERRNEDPPYDAGGAEIDGYGIGTQVQENQNAFRAMLPNERQQLRVPQNGAV